MQWLWNSPKGAVGLTLNAVPICCCSYDLLLVYIPTKITFIIYMYMCVCIIFETLNKNEVF